MHQLVGKPLGHVDSSSTRGWSRQATPYICVKTGTEGGSPKDKRAKGEPMGEREKGGPSRNKIQSRAATGDYSAGTVLKALIIANYT